MFNPTKFSAFHMTLPTVLDDLRNARAQLHIATIPFILKTQYPSSGGTRAVSDFSRKTRDYPRLSRVDIQVLAVIYDIVEWIFGGGGGEGGGCATKVILQQQSWLILWQLRNESKQIWWCERGRFFFTPLLIILSPYPNRRRSLHNKRKTYHPTSPPPSLPSIYYLPKNMYYIYTSLYT